MALDPAGQRLFSLQGGRLVEQRLGALEQPARVIGRHAGQVTLASRWPGRLVTADTRGEVRVWDVETGRVEREFRTAASAEAIALDPLGRYLAAAPFGGLGARSLFLLDWAAPRGAEPIALTQREKDWLNSIAFHPQGQWLASGHAGWAMLWNLAGRRATVLRGQRGGYVVPAFTSDGRLVSSSDEGAVRLWSLGGNTDQPVRTLWSKTGAQLGTFLDVDRQQRWVVVANRFRGQLVLVPLDGSSAESHVVQGGGWTMNATFDPSGRRVAFAYVQVGRPDTGSIRIVDLVTHVEQVLKAPTTTGACERAVARWGSFDTPAWLSDGRLVSDGLTGLRIWDLAAGTSRQLRPCRPVAESADVFVVRSTPDSRAVVTLMSPGSGSSAGVSELTVVDLTSSASRIIASHGARVQSFALDPTGRTLVTGAADGLVRVGPLTGDEPHLLYGHTRTVTGLAVSADGKWIASGSDDETIRLWPMPGGPPLHTQPHAHLLAKLRAQTNLRVVPDTASATGYKIDADPFVGWAKPPEW